MSHDTENEHMENPPTIPLVPEPKSIHNGNILSASVTSVPADEDAYEDELDNIQPGRSGKRLLRHTFSSPDAEEVAFDLMYPESEDVAVSL
jgi:hypothetical protein